MREALKKIEAEDAAREARERERAVRGAAAMREARNGTEAAELSIVSEPQAPEQPLIYIGDIGVSETWIWTPNGVFPIKGSRWTVSDTTAITKHTSGAGIALAIIFFAFTCGLSLLFLLMKEVNVTGSVQVTVAGEGFQHTAMIAAGARDTGWVITQRVNWARGLAARP